MAARLTQTVVWRNLEQHRDELKAMRLQDIVLGEAKRLETCSLELEGLSLNYAFNHVTPKTIDLLVKLAEQEKLEGKRDQMFRGDKVNVTENRAVLHTALRQKTNHPVMVDGKDMLPEIKAAREKVAKFAGDVRDGVWLGATGKPIKHVVNIGIGGSDLGPRLAVEALALHAIGPKVHFVANADAYDLLSTLKGLDPAQTLFVVVSKTFTTQETLLNAQTARQWLVAALGEKAVQKHFVAVSTNQAAVETFGIKMENVFPMWDWVGGRFSLWSAVGLSIALAIGADNFQKLCDGAAAMDEHFRTAPLAYNMPVVLALLGIWQRNFQNISARAVLPYCERLRSFPRFLQQLDMESNGKSVTRDGEAAAYATGPIIFGDCGTVGQHSFHQWLHQGSEIVATDFIGVAEDDLNHADHHRALVSHMVAQAGAFAFGQTESTKPEDIYAGNRPSNILMLLRLDPYHLGLLLALFEHKIFVQGVVWNLNSFDQPGVELGKKLARGLESGTAPSGDQAAFLKGFFTRISRISKK